MTKRIYMNPAHDSAELRAIVQAANPDAQIMGRAPRPAPAPVCRTELPPEAEQFVIPGCEHKRPPAPSAKLRQPTLWD
jgi:hypothetical protein